MSRAKIGIATAVIVIIGLTVAAFQIPPTYQYKKEVDIVAQQRMVFVFIGELKRWSQWTKWAARDPKMENEFSTPSWGEGATYKWKSRSSGEGMVKVTRFQHETFMAYDLIPDGYEPSKWEFTLRPAQRQGTTVTWTVEGRYPENRFWRLLTYVMMWGLPSDMQKSLDRLRKHAELHEAYDVTGDWEPKRAGAK